ncbi:MAG: Rpn family recombination-promoting nuclease/putative transposase [Saprospiraceae bacterium]|nr:Rpn family recombination-promoting nuclease/putative transposase [Saprospiraceae bacterium]
MTKESYINSDLSEYFSDLVFDAKVLGQSEHLDIALLFEHKSAPDKNVLIQVGFYMF